MLHIITPLFRFENLEKLWNSIPMNEDIIWHISKSNKREELSHEFLKTDKRIKIYNVDCEDDETYHKRNAVLKNIKSGYFCFLDDDTIFHENMYMKYSECKETNFIGMLIGNQIYLDGEIRLNASKPKFCGIDTGNVLSHSSCLSEVEWPIDYDPKTSQRDFLFWSSVFKFYNIRCALWYKPISYYNTLNKKDDNLIKLDSDFLTNIKNSKLKNPKIKNEILQKIKQIKYPK